MLDDLKARGVKFQSLTEHIDTETPTGRAMWQIQNSNCRLFLPTQPGLQFCFVLAVSIRDENQIAERRSG